MIQSKLLAAISVVVLLAAFTAGAQDRPVAATQTVPLWVFPPSSIPNFSTDTVKNHTLPGSSEKFSYAQLVDRSAAVDWFPGEHPVMPPAVKGGRGPAFACGFCHLPVGSGRPENAELAGMPYDYLKQQVRDMKSGARGQIDPHFIPGGNMLRTIQQTDETEADEAVKYFSELKYTKRVKVVESELTPQVTENGFVYVFHNTGAREPLGERIVEGPDDFAQFESRDYRTTYSAYVPVGSIARGEALAKGSAARAACSICHGDGLKGGSIGPPIAGRFPTSNFRQLYAFQTGSRHGPQAALMAPIVAGLSQKDMIDLAAYVGSLAP